MLRHYIFSEFDTAVRRMEKSAGGTGHEAVLLAEAARKADEAGRAAPVDTPAVTDPVEPVPQAPVPAFDPSFGVITSYMDRFNPAKLYDSTMRDSDVYREALADRIAAPNAITESMADFISSMAYNRGDYDGEVDYSDSYTTPMAGTFDRGGENSIEANPDAASWQWIRTLANPDGTFPPAVSNSLQRINTHFGGGNLDWNAVGRMVGTSFPAGFLATPAQRAAAFRTAARQNAETAALPPPPGSVIAGNRR